MALATIESLSFSYPEGPPALLDVSLELREGATRAPRPPWRVVDWCAVGCGAVLVVVGAAWL